VIDIETFRKKNHTEGKNTGKGKQATDFYWSRDINNRNQLVIKKQKKAGKKISSFLLLVFTDK